MKKGNGQETEPPEPQSAPAILSGPSSTDLASARGTNRSQSTPVGDPQLGNAKIAIPRQNQDTTPRYSRRVPRACEACRRRKSKCSGDTPLCRQCRELGLICYYPVGWREKMTREVQRLSAAVQEYESLLHDLRNATESRTSGWVKALLDKHGQNTTAPFEHPQSLLSASQNTVESDKPSSPLSIGSLEAIDRVDEDLNRTNRTRATGFIGKTSEISWMKRLQKEINRCSRNKKDISGPAQGKKEETKDRVSLHTMNYRLDDLDICVPEPIQLYTLPSKPLADQLIDDYLETVHPFFPIISKSVFRLQYETLFDNSTRPSDKWLAILNIIFAISARHAHLIRAPWRGDENDHLVYLTRGRRLSMNGEILFSHPDLQQVQVEGLIAFYLAASDQINRAWRIQALALRSAITLGINLKAENPKNSSISKETRYRVWWSLYTFEHLLGVMTGRAIYTLEGGYSTPLPLPFEEHQLQDDPIAIELLNDPALRDERIGEVMASSWISAPDDTQTPPPRDQTWLKGLPANTGLCYLYYCDLAVVTQEIVNKVYSTNAVTLVWSEIESRLDELKARIELWKSSLPAAFDFGKEPTDDSHEQLRCRLVLAFHYYSARMILGRPCFCRRDARQRNSPWTYSCSMAIFTLESATCMLDLIPDDPNVFQLYHLCPWWGVLRYLMQAATIILLELSFGCVHVPGKEENLVGLSKKSIRWLFAMSDRSVGSRRAWQLCDSSFRNLANKMNYNTDDIPSPSSQPGNPPTEAMSETHSGSDQVASFAPSDYHDPRSEDLMDTFRPIPEAGFYTTYLNFPTPDLTTSLQLSSETDASYFPYDSLSEELMRSFLPSFDGDSGEQC
ncbi:hypothetical protein N7508_009702 [Penicillium antarcticum]|uniref:uncharacterized protein n=1 Tax=Penicillium antarcticum TaxID=416450 RepID=UPI0023868291|nr:uncharacterized protein N7508_009702 [Penicillium antarcticum]KAJ5294881.1 hypothetical protein N7508_009702 [Penicillium antarcticum]